MYTQNSGDPQERPDAGIAGAGLDLLIGGARQAGRQVDGLLCAVVAEASDSDAVADGAALLEQPGVVIGEAGHSTNALPKIIGSLPCLSGII